jgi:hypothetical protein
VYRELSLWPGDGALLPNAINTTCTIKNGRWGWQRTEDSFIYIVAGTQDWVMLSCSLLPRDFAILSVFSYNTSNNRSFFLPLCYSVSEKLLLFGDMIFKTSKKIYKNILWDKNWSLYMLRSQLHNPITKPYHPIKINGFLYFVHPLGSEITWKCNVSETGSVFRL